MPLWAGARMGRGAAGSIANPVRPSPGPHLPAELRPLVDEQAHGAGAQQQQQHLAAAHHLHVVLQVLEDGRRHGGSTHPSTSVGPH